MYRRRLLALGLIASLVACGGGGGSSPAPGGPNATAPVGATPTPGGVPQGQARATFSITVPQASTSATRRSARSVPNGTQSIRFTLIKSDNAQAVTPSASPVYPLTAATPGCSSGPNGLTCVIQITAPLGTNIYVADVYGTADGSGRKFGSGSVRLVVLDNAANTASLTLAGAIASVVLSTDDVADGQNLSQIEYLTPLAGVHLTWPPNALVPQSARIFVVALDAQGNQIISPDTFSTPVTLTLGSFTPPAGVAGAPSAAGTARSPSLNPNATPAPQSLANLAVAYAFPQNAVTSDTTTSVKPTVQVLSPADTTVIAPYAGPDGGFLAVSATVNGTVAPRQLHYGLLPSQCQPGYSGTAPYNCVAPTPVPLPLAWQNPNGYKSFTSTGFGNAKFEAGFDPNQSFVGYTFRLSTNGVSKTVTLDATSCYPQIAAVVASPNPSPSPSPDPNATPTPSPSPTPSATPVPSAGPSTSPSPGPPVLSHRPRISNVTLPNATPSPRPTPNPAVYRLVVTGADPVFTFFVPTRPAVGTCTAKATDTASHEADLSISVTQSSLIIQGRERR